MVAMPRGGQASRGACAAGEIVVAGVGRCRRSGWCGQRFELVEGGGEGCGPGPGCLQAQRGGAGVEGEAGGDVQQPVVMPTPCCARSASSTSSPARTPTRRPRGRARRTASRAPSPACAFKQGPLYVQQLLTTTGESRAFAAVLRDYFCLLTEQARTEAAAAVYGPLQRRMRDEGVADFELIVIPVTQTAPRAEAALAVGREGRLRLTARGRAC